MNKDTIERPSCFWLNGVEPNELSISSSLEDNAQTISLSGCLVSQTAGLLFCALVEALETRCDDIRLDLSGVIEMSRAGVGGIVVAAKVLQMRGGRLKIVGASASVRQVIANLMLAHLFPAEGSEKGASISDRRRSPKAEGKHQPALEESDRS